MIDGINHIALSVRDLQESFEFYREILRLTPIMLSSKRAYFKAGDSWLVLHEEKNKNQNNELYTHIAFNATEENYRKIEVFLVKFKVSIWKDNSTEGESFYFKDPSGNKLEIHCSDLKSRIEFGKKSIGMIPYNGLCEFNHMAIVKFYRFSAFR